MAAGELSFHLFSVFLSPHTELVQNFHQRLSAGTERIFHFGGNLRILCPHNKTVLFQLLEICAQGLV